jgi:nucleotide-binding universal stress UspA family protein
MRLFKLQTILVATDLTETSVGAMVSAARLASAAGATLHVAHVASEQNELNADADRRAEYEQAIGNAVDAAKTTTAAQTHLMFGEPPHALASLADKLSADVLVLGRRERTPKADSDRPVGSTAYACVTRTLVPVLVIVEPISIPLRSALVAVDASVAARGSLLMALSWSSALRDRSSTNGRLIIFHVDTGNPATEDAARLRQSAAHDADVLQRNAPGWAGVTVERITIKDPDPAAAISRHAMDSGAALVILGTRASADHGLSAWGSVSAAVTRQLSIPVLLVPPAIWRDHERDIDPF